MIKPESTSEQHFSTWAFSTVERLRKAVGIGAILAAAVSIRYLEPEQWLRLQPNDLKGFLNNHVLGQASLALIQAAACFLLALLTPKPSIASLKHREHMSKRELTLASKSCQRIQLYVVASYLARSVYYLITGLSLWNKQQQDDLINRAILVSLNLLPSLMLFWLYLELAEFTVETARREGKKNGETSSENEESTGSSNAAFYQVLSIGVLALVVAPTWYAYAQKAQEIITISEVATSWLNGVSLALVVGRLGSKIIDPGSITLGLLYFYAVIQPTAATFHDNPAVHLFATTVALPLKILLWLVLVWAFTTGILSEYVHDIRILLTKEHRSELVEE